MDKVEEISLVSQGKTMEQRFSNLASHLTCGNVILGWNLILGVVRKLKNTFKNYQILFRIMPVLPKFVINFILDHSLQRYFKYLPRKFVIFLADHYVSLARHDYSAINYLKYYFFQIKKIIKFKVFKQKIWNS